MKESEISSKARFQWGDVEKNWKWHLLLGFFFVVTGTIGLVVTPLATLSSVLLFASFMMAGGVLQLIEAIGAAKGWKSRLLNIVSGFVYIAGGVVCAINPVAASLALTLILAASIFVVGVFRVVTAFQHKDELRDWGIVLVSGLASIAIAILIGISWPFSALWTLGIFISVDLIFNGWSHVVIALAARKSFEERERPSGHELAGSASA